MRTMILTISFVLASYSFADSKAEIAGRIADVASANGLDPDIAVAIATVESGLNPKAVGGLGEIGLFQLRPEYHNVIRFNERHNIRVAITYLLSLKTKFHARFGDAWFVLYNYGPYNPPREPRKTAYYQRVMKEVSRIRTIRYLAAN